MAKPFTQWTVLPHGKVARLDDNLWSVAGLLRMPPLGDVERRMTIACLRDRRLVVYSAIALDEAEMRQIEASGTPAFLVIPSDIHRMDARVWTDRYPEMKVIAPPAARAKVEEIVPVDATSFDFGDPSVELVVVPGTGEREAALVVETGNGTSLVVSDLIFHLAHRPGLTGWLFKAIGMTGDEPRLPAIVRMREVTDKRALAAQFERWARIPNLRRIVISHGPIIEKEPAKVLSRIAHELQVGRDRAAEPTV